MASVASPDGTMSLEDRDLRSLLSWTALGRPIADHFLCRDDPELTRGVELAEGRRSGFTRFDGNVAALAIDQDLVPPLLSATRLEAYAGCPRHYFFESVLRVLPRPTDVKLLATDRMDRGKLVHRILERFVEPQLGVRVSDDPEGLFDVERLMAIAQKEMETFAADGFSGPRTAWRVEQIQIRRELRAFAAVDRQWRIDNDIQTTGVEQKFGSEGVEPVAVDVPGRQPVRFRGTIDRVDVTPDRGRIVTDYKTGGADWYKGIEGDHFQGGRSLQLAIYALAVGEDGQKPVRTEYWFVSEKGGFARRGYELTSEEAEEFTKVIDVLSASMARGQFPANPGGGMNQKFDPCAYCPYDSVCPKDRDQIWERTKGDPILSRYVALAES
jgi:ATP-dependent helicase/DNAse subunit B